MKRQNSKTQFKQETSHPLYFLNNHNSSKKFSQAVRTLRPQKPQVKSSRVNASINRYKKQTNKRENQQRQTFSSTFNTGRINSNNLSKTIETSIESRMRKIIDIFNEQEDAQKIEEILLNIRSKFDYYERIKEERKLKMIYDEMDRWLNEIVHKFQIIIGTVVSSLIDDQQKKLLQVRRNIQKLALNYQSQIMQLKKKNQYYRFEMEQKIEELMAKSLITSETINFIQFQGALNFEKWTQFALCLPEDQNEGEENHSSNKRYKNNDILLNFV